MSLLKCFRRDRRYNHAPDEKNDWGVTYAMAGDLLDRTRAPGDGPITIEERHSAFVLTSPSVLWVATLIDVNKGRECIIAARNLVTWAKANPDLIEENQLFHIAMDPVPFGDPRRRLYEYICEFNRLLR